MDNSVIPSKINMFNLYNGSKNVGITGEVQLPDIEMMSEELKGSGILGSIDDPAIGQFNSLYIDIPFQVTNDCYFDLSNPLLSIPLTLRGSVQVTDRDGNVKFKGMRIVMRGKQKKLTPGTVKLAAGMESKVGLELTYYMVEYDGKKRIEIDKLNSVFRLNGVDVLAAARALC